MVTSLRARVGQSIGRPSRPVREHPELPTRSRSHAARPTARPRVLVTDAGRGSAIAVIRSLGERGWDVVAADADGSSPGFHSRRTAGRLRYPPPLEDPARAGERLLWAVNHLGIDLVVPVTDELILAIETVRDDLERRARVALPDAGLLEVASDKSRTLDLARSLGVPTPRSLVVDPALEDRCAAAAQGRDLGWPVVVKPVRSRTRSADGSIARHTVSYAADVVELQRAVADAGQPVLIQEYVHGTGVGVELLLRDGEPIVAFQHRRLREVPVTGGASAYRESVPLDPALLDDALRPLRALGWTGLAMVEFRVGPDGSRLMEINGRIWGSLPLATLAGVDFPGLLADVFLGRPLAPHPPLGVYRLGVRSRNLPLEVAWIAAVLAGRRRYPTIPTPPRRAGLAAAARLVAPDGWDVLSIRDPLPGLVEIERLVEQSAARGIRALRDVARPGRGGRPA